MDSEECIICQLVDGKIPTKDIYEDDDVLVVLDFNGANLGHSFVIPKEHYPILEKLPNHLVAKLFNVANKVSSAIFETIGCSGTNIFVANGIPAGQRIAHFMIHVIPRSQNDGINLGWKPKQLNEEEMSTIELKLKEEIDKLGFGSSGTEKQSQSIKETQKTNFISSLGDEEDYFTKQLRRIP